MRPLLDTAFGLFVWAVHLFLVYTTTATACQLGLGTSSGGTRNAVLAALAVATLATVALVALHALRRYREQRASPELRFRMSVTLGCDAIAAVAIAWQLLAIFLLPLCA